MHQQFPHWIEARKGYLWLNEASTGPIVSLYRAEVSGGMAIIQYDYFRSLVHVEKAGKWIVFSGGPDPTQSHLYRTEVTGSKAFQPRQLTSGTGQFGAVYSPTAAFMC